MKNLTLKFSSLVVLSLAGASLLGVAPALAQGTIVYDSIPSPTPPNVPSVGFQANQTAEFGDEVALEADTPRRVGYATVLMSSWSVHSDYPAMPAAGYSHPITLSIYTSAALAVTHTPVKTVTRNFVIPWRPAGDPTCPDTGYGAGFAWRAADNNCYNGFAFKIEFDLRGWNYDLPGQLIYGIAYNTNTWGYAPIGVPGPYESLNVGLNSTPPVAVGTDVNADAVYWNTMTPGNYTDGGAGGIGTFRLDTAWAPYTPAVQFRTFALPTNAASCKNGAWQNLVRSNFTPFKNQGDCIQYVNTGK